jgi:hypothetical protein
MAAMPEERKAELTAIAMDNALRMQTDNVVNIGNSLLKRNQALPKITLVATAIGATFGAATAVSTLGRQTGLWRRIRRTWRNRRRTGRRKKE